MIRKSPLKKLLISICVVMAIALLGGLFLLWRPETKRLAGTLALQTGESKLMEGEAPDEPNTAAVTSADPLEFQEQALRPDPKEHPREFMSEPAELCKKLAKSVRNGQSDQIIAISQQLIALGDEAVAHLIELLNCGDCAVEMAALRILSQIGTAEAMAAALGKVLATARNGEDGARLLNQFANVRTPAVADLLVKMLGETDQQELRNLISEILSVMEGPAVVKALARGIEEPIDQLHMQDCAEIMARLNKPSNIAALEEVLLFSTDATARRAAAIALANIGNAEACNVLAEQAEKQTDISGLCSEALSTVISPYGQETLLAILQMTDYSTEVRAAAATALGNYNSSYVRNRLVNLVNSETDQAVKVAINNSADQIGELTAESRLTQTAPSEFVEGTDE